MDPEKHLLSSMGISQGTPARRDLTPGVKSLICATVLSHQVFCNIPCLVTSVSVCWNVQTRTETGKSWTNWDTLVILVTIFILQNGHSFLLARFCRNNFQCLPRTTTSNLAVSVPLYPLSQSRSCHSARTQSAMVFPLFADRGKAPSWCCSQWW